jgi:SAM-dependent methyltransferase
MSLTCPDVTPGERACLLAAVFLMSAAMLGFQILQVVVLSLQLFPETAFLVVSLSRLGLGCGGSLATALARRREPVRLPSSLWNAAIAFALTMFAAMVISSRLHGLLLLILVNAVPYAFVGLFLSLMFAAWSGRATVIYFYDLLGAACGCAAIVVLLNRLADAGTVAIVLAATAGIATVLVGATFSPRRTGTAALLVIAGLALIPWTGSLFRFGPAPEKFYGQLLAKGAAGGKVARREWNFLGRVDAFLPGPAVAEFDFARQAKDLMDDGCQFRLLFSNGYNWTFTVDFAGHTSDGRRVFDRWVQNTPYLFTDAPVVLNLGSGGGADVYLAIANGARSATAVEINPLMIEATTRWYAHDWDDLWSRPEVTVRELDARTFVNTTDQRFDVVTLNAVDTAGTQASLLSVNFLYTTEAFGRYLDVLRPGGVIFFTRPRDQLLRATAAAVAALRARGTTGIEHHVAVLGSGELLSAAIYIDPLVESQLDTLQRRVRDGYVGGALQYAPDTDTGSNLFTGYFTAVQSGDEAAYFHRIALRADPTTDNQPYFYQLEPSFFASVAGRILVLILLFVTSIGMLLIFTPLLRLEVRDKNRVLTGHLAYFGCLGLGFMLTEICLMQQLSLILGHPAYSVSVTLAGMLVCCGLGSLVAGTFPARLRPYLIPGALVASTVAIILYALLVERVASSGPASLTGRIVLCLAFLAPGSFFMGMPFPLKLRSLEGADGVLVPWAWAVNGLASVAGSVLAVALTMNFGFRAVLFMAGGLYLAALFAHGATSPSASGPRRTRRNRPPDALTGG